MTPVAPTPSPSPIIIPRWLPIALGEIGIVEDVRPGRSTARIEQYHAATAAGVAPDDVAWCASYVGWCLEQAGIRSTRSKTAASYATWGVPCVAPGLRGPHFAIGSVVVFGKRDADAVGSGHVGFCMGRSGAELYLLGGNQQNRVSIATRKVADVVAVRWPSAVQLPSMRPPAA